jgi:hypothetical protein
LRVRRFLSEVRVRVDAFDDALGEILDELDSIIRTVCLIGLGVEGEREVDWIKALESLEVKVRVGNEAIGWGLRVHDALEVGGVLVASDLGYR